MTRNDGSSPRYVELSRVYFDIALCLTDPQMRCGAVDMFYNAAEQAAKALYASHVGSTPDPVGGVYSRFGQYLSEAGVLSVELGMEMAWGFATRNIARFEPSAEIKPSDVDRIRALAEGVLSLAENEGS
jgi:hypothetical protein